MSTKRKPPSKLAAPVFKESAKPLAKTRIDESKTSVSAGRAIGSQRPIPPQDTVSISSGSSEEDEDSSEDEEDDSEDESEDGDNDEEETAAVNGKEGKSKSRIRSQPPSTSKESSTARLTVSRLKRTAPDDPSASDSEPQSPTFGELARTRIVDVQAQLSQQQQQQQQQQGTPVSLSLITPVAQAGLAPPSLSSLGTVLTQALQSDDTELLESCLQTTDLAVVRATIQRLDSSLAAALLSRLASRMHRRPGRASTLISWVQWTLISHGGTLAAQPDLHRKLSDLNRVLEERARGLNSLLALKGKLDLLEAQMQLRRASKAAGLASGPNGGLLGFGDGSDEEEDANVVYVEGTEDNAINGTSASGGAAEDADDDADDQFDISAVNGVDSDSEEDDDDDSDEDMDDADDYRRAAAGEEPLDDDEVDFDDVDDESAEDDSDVEAAAPPAKVQKISSSFPKRR